MTEETIVAHEENRRFWQEIFGMKDLANRLLLLNQEFGDRGMEIYHSYYGVSVVKAKPASVIGDNFFSDAFIVDALTKRDKLNFTAFAKVLPTNLVMREAANDAGMHQRESGMYCKLFPLLKQIIDVPDTIFLDVPQVYYGHVKEVSQSGGLDKDKQSGTCIVLENAFANRYLMRDKCLGADDEHTRTAFTSLAHLHALTLTALKSWIDPLTETVSLPDSIRFLFDKTLADHSPAESIAPWVRVFIELTSELNRPDIAQWLTEVSKNLDEIMQFDTFKTCGPVPCILHGDFWINNMLFKYEKGNDGAKDRPVATKMVDFQMSRIGHPSSDILYFLFTSTTSQMRKDHARDWLRHYYETLMADLAKLETEITESTYSWEEFLSDYKKRSLRWMLFSGMIMSLVLNKQVADELDVLHRTINKQQENDALMKDARPINSDVTMKLTDQFTGIIKANKISNNPALTARLVELFEEVKDMNESNGYLF